MHSSELPETDTDPTTSGAFDDFDCGISDLPVITHHPAGDKNTQVNGYKGLISCSADQCHLLEELDVETATDALNSKSYVSHLDTTDSVFRRILDDWSRVCVDTATEDELDRWRAAYPSLNPITAITDLPAMSKTAPDTLFSALLHLHQGGSQLAGHALLTLMIPKLRRLTRHVHEGRGNPGSTHGERASITVCAFLDVIATFKGTGTSVAGALSLQTLGIITRPSNSVASVPVDAEFLSSVAPTEASSFDSSADDADKLLHWSVRTNVISALDCTLLRLAYLTDEGADLSALAERFDLSPSALRQRLHRTVSAIQSAVCDHLDIAKPPKKSRRIHSNRGAPMAHLSLAS